MHAAMIERAEKFEESDNWSAAAEIWRQIVAVTPSAFSFVRYGSALQSAGHIEDAIAQFRKATEIDPREARGFFSLGVAFDKLERLPEARAAYEAGLQIEEHQGVLTLLGGVLLDMGLMVEAERPLRRSLELRPNDDEALFALGMAVKDRDVGAAVEYLSKAARLDPSHPRLHRELGYCLMVVKNYEAAERVLRSAVKDNPADAWAFHYLGHVLTWRNDLPGAKDAFLKAAELRPEVGFFWTTSADVLAKLGRPGEADRLMLHALGLAIGDPLTNLQYGLFLRDSGRPQKAVTYLERALSDPRLSQRAQRALDAIIGGMAGSGAPARPEKPR
jgi:Flp pilus assembly protein TadD